MTIVEGNCMDCGKHVVDGENGWVLFLQEENHTECLCGDCDTD